MSEPYFSNRSQDFLHRFSPGLFSSLRNQCFRVLRDATQLWYNFHNSHSILVVAFSSLVGKSSLSSAFCLVVHQPYDAGTNTCPRLCSPFLHCKINTREDANIHKAIACKYLSNNIYLVVEEWHHGYFSLGYSSSSTHFDLVSLMGGIRVGFLLCAIVTLIPENALVCFRTVAFFFPLVTSTFSSFNATHSLSILDHCSWFNSLVPRVKVSQSEISDLCFSSPSFSIFDNRASISSNESPCISELQQQAHAQGLELQDAQHGYVLNLDEKRFVYKKTYRWRRRFSVILTSEACTKREKWKEVKNYELTKSQCKKEKIMRQCKSSFLSCKIWRTDEFYEWSRNFKKWNQITEGDRLTFPVGLQWCQVLVPFWAATNACLLTHGTHRDYRKTFLVILFRGQYQRVHHSSTPSDTGSVPVQIGSGTPVARDEDQKRGTVPMPTFARKPSTEFYNTGGLSAEFYGWTAKTANIGIAIRQIP